MVNYYLLFFCGKSEWGEETANVKRNGSARKRAAIQWVMTHWGCPSLRDVHKKKGHDFHRIPLIFTRKAILRSGPKAYSLKPTAFYCFTNLIVVNPLSPFTWMLYAPGSNWLTSMPPVLMVSPFELSVLTI